MFIAEDAWKNFEKNNFFFENTMLSKDSHLRRRLEVLIEKLGQNHRFSKHHPLTGVSS
jgi:hypothetical protein